MNVIGLDLSLRSTGAAGVDAQGNWWTRRVVPTAGLTGMARIADIYRQVMAVLEAQKPVSLIAIEDYAIRGGENIPIVELGAAIRFALFLHQYPFVVVHPSKVKMYMTGKGNADKVLVGQALQARHSISFLRTDWPGHAAKKPKPQPAGWGEKDAHWRNDEADAFTLAQIARQLVAPDSEDKLTDYEAQVLNALRLDSQGEFSRSLLVRKGEARSA